MSGPMLPIGKYYATPGSEIAFPYEDLSSFEEVSYSDVKKAGKDKFFLVLQHSGDGGRHYGKKVTYGLEEGQAAYFQYHCTHEHVGNTDLIDANGYILRYKEYWLHRKDYIQFFAKK